MGEQGATRPGQQARSGRSIPSLGAAQAGWLTRLAPEDGERDSSCTFYSSMVRKRPPPDSEEDCHGRDPGKQSEAVSGPGLAVGRQARETGRRDE